jgi:hypothetical protein
MKQITINLLAFIVAVCFLLPSAKAQKAAAAPGTIIEKFENAEKKGRYPVGDLKAASGSWNFSDALLWDKEPSDFKPMAPRILAASSLEDEAGSISTNFDLKGLKKVKVGFIGFKADPGFFQIEVFISKNKGKDWESIGTARGNYSKDVETFSEFKTNAKKTDELRVKIVNASAPKLNRYNRINITLVELECGN